MRKLRRAFKQRGVRRKATMAGAGTLVTAVIAVLLLSAGEPASVGGTTTGPIHHVVVILQENHSFDNVLGYLCATEKKYKKTCKYATIGHNKNKEIPLEEATDKIPGVAHGQTAQLEAMDEGEMDGWDSIAQCQKARKEIEKEEVEGKEPETKDPCYEQFHEGPVKNLWHMARKGAISDAYYSRDIVPSWGAHLDFFAQTLDGFVGNNPKFEAEGVEKEGVTEGPGWGCDSNRDTEWSASGAANTMMEPSCIPNKKGEGPYRKSPVPYVPTVADRIEEAEGELSWGIYSASTKGEEEGPYKWAICPTFYECLHEQKEEHMRKASQLFEDAETGQLPNFAIVTPTVLPPTSTNSPSGETSQHNGTSMGFGDEYIAKEVQAIQKGPDAPSTTIFIYYDDCGCFYDHVPPPEKGLGIRLPLVIISPYAKRGFVDHNEATNSSILAYMESVLHVKPVDKLDETAYNFEEAFDYSQPPTEPFKASKDPIPPGDRHLPPPPEEDT